MTALLHAPTAAAAVGRASKYVAALPWELCTRNVQVNLARYWKQSLPEKFLSISPDEIVLHRQDAPAAGALPDFDAIFRDRLTTHFLEGV